MVVLTGAPCLRFLYFMHDATLIAKFVGFLFFKNTVCILLAAFAGCGLFSVRLYLVILLLLFLFLLRLQDFLSLSLSLALSVCINCISGSGAAVFSQELSQCEFAMASIKNNKIHREL